MLRTVLLLATVATTHLLASLNVLVLADDSSSLNARSCRTRFRTAHLRLSPSLVGPFIATPALFGRCLASNEHQEGNLLLLSDHTDNGCRKLPKAPSRDSVAVLSRGNCTFASKARSAARAGYRGLVILDTRHPKGTNLLFMEPDGKEEPGIWTVLVQGTRAGLLLNTLQGTKMVLRVKMTLDPAYGKGGISRKPTNHHLASSPKSSEVERAQQYDSYKIPAKLPLQRPQPNKDATLIVFTPSSPDYSQQSIWLPLATGASLLISSFSILLVARAAVRSLRRGGSLDLESLERELDPTSEEIPMGLSQRQISYLPLSTEKEGTCAICLDELQLGSQVVALGCTHGFHQSCAGEWLSRRGVCPCCKAEVKVEGGGGWWSRILGL